MAKRRKTVRRTRKRVAAKRVSRRKAGMTPAQLRNLAIGSAGYGAIRGYASDILQKFGGQLPIVSNILASVGDEVLLGAAGYMLAKKAKKPILRNIGTAALVVESARFGSVIGEKVNFGKARIAKTADKIF